MEAARPMLSGKCESLSPCSRLSSRVADFDSTLDRTTIPPGADINDDNPMFGVAKTLVVSLFTSRSPSSRD
jgi:hypothetical protein